MTDINELTAVWGGGELGQSTLQASITAADGDLSPEAPGRGEEMKAAVNL